MTFSLLIAAFTLGLFSTAHCLFMCGGISQALTFQQEKQVVMKTLLFHAGRIACYGFLGLVIGAVIYQFATEYHTLSRWLRHGSGVLLIVIGLYIAGRGSLLKALEKRLGFFWRFLQPAVKRTMKMEKTYHAIGLGFLWGFLPCGLIYSMLLWAAASTQGVETSVVMLAFGLGTLPGFLLLHSFSVSIRSFLQKKPLRLIIGGLFIVFGLWTILPLIPQFSFIKHPFC